MQKDDEQRDFFTLMTFGGCMMALGLIISLSIYFSAVKPNREELDNWKETKCSISNTTATPYPCCITTSCQCAECSSQDTCSSLVGGLTNGTCCNGYYCCETRYNTCCRRRCDSNGRNCRRKCRKCNPYCYSSVQNQLCESLCGTCHNVSADIFIDQIEKTQVITGNCPINDNNCVNSWFSNWADGSERRCWYHEDNHEIQVRWDGPSKDTTAIVFMWFFVAVLLSGFLVALSPQMFVFGSSIKEQFCVREVEEEEEGIVYDYYYTASSE